MVEIKTQLPTSALLAYFGLFAVTLTAHLIHVPVYTHMILTVHLCIFIGSVRGIHIKAEEQETMATSDVYMFPVTGSITLFSLYMAFKFLPAEYINMVIKSWFFVIGVLVLAQQFCVLLEHMIPSKWYEPWSKVCVKLSMGPILPFKKVKPSDKADKDGLEDMITLTNWDIVGFILSSLIGAWYIITNHWSASNIFGFAFSIQSIESLMLGSYFNGFILLFGLFFYDIFWVFGTDVMVTVAKSFDAPIKLLFPNGNFPPSMLGLGDIVIPGLLIALMLRFDVYLYKRSNQQGPQTSFFYFWTVLFFYFLGLSITVLVMYSFKSAQPALLYLVPACLLGTIVPALIRGHGGLLWYYVDEEKPKEE